MPPPEFFISFDSLIGKSLSDLPGIFKTVKKKAVGDIKIAELCSMDSYPNGVYLFFSSVNNDEILQYVGRASSRSFVERIPSHFDQRHSAWFNTLPKKIMAILDSENYADAHAIGLSMSLVIVGIKDKATSIKIEKTLRAYLKPKLNSSSGRFLGNEVLCNYPNQGLEEIRLIDNI